MLYKEECNEEETPTKKVKMEKALGLDKLADDLRKTSKGFMNDLDLMYSSDESD